MQIREDHDDAAKKKVSSMKGEIEFLRRLRIHGLAAELRKFCAHILLLALFIGSMLAVPAINYGRPSWQEGGHQASKQSAKPEQKAKFREVEKATPNRYIVVFDDKSPSFDLGPLGVDPSSAERNAALSKERKDRVARIVEARASQLAQSHGATIEHIYTHSIRGFSAEMSEKEAKALSENPEVSYVEQDGVVSINEAQSPCEWGLDRINQRNLPINNSYSYTNTGEGVNVYVIDTGIRTTHVEFGGRAFVAANLVRDGKDGNDCNGHGTHVAGTIGSATYGVAKGVTLNAVRVMKCDGTGSPSTVIAGIDWVAANHVNPSVVNMSLGGPTSTAMDDAVRRAVADGVTFVVAAGNSNKDAINGSPSRVDEAIVVGATDKTDKRASFSNYGGILDVFAPGVGIRSTWNTSDMKTQVLDGTSMAAPHVAGVAALYLQRNPTAGPFDVENLIRNNATSFKVKSAGTGSPNRLLHTPPNLYQRHSNGRIWQYLEPEITGWEELDNNSATVALVADEGSLYQLHNSGWIWKYTGPPFTGWEVLDNNSDTTSIIAGGGNLYQLHFDGSIWKYLGTPISGWELLDNNSDTVAIVAGGTNLYQLHFDGSIWKYTGTPLTGWQLLDNNSDTTSIVADEGDLYQLHFDGSIWRYTGTPLTGWQLLDNNSATVRIVADEGSLYQLHSSGAIWRYTGTPLTGWELLDNNSHTTAIVAGGGNLYQLHFSGAIWRYTGTPLTGWQLLDNNPNTAGIVAD